jgi:hypothetical protein
MFIVEEFYGTRSESGSLYKRPGSAGSPVAPVRKAGLPMSAEVTPTPRCRAELRLTRTTPHVRERS